MPAAFQEIEGFRCYAPDVALDTADYPSEGFDLTAEVEARSFWCRSRNRVLRLVFERFTDRSRPLDMLEIGCGIGGVIAELRRLPNLRVTGSEIYLQGLRYARSRLPGVDLIQLDATDMPFQAEFDVIGAFDVLEHIGADERVMAEVFDALRPGGLFVVTVPQYAWMWSPLDDLVRHKRRYGRRDLVGKLRRAGFEVVYSTSFVTTLFPCMLLARLRSRMRRRSDDTKTQLAAEVDLPGPLNRVFDWVMRVDEAALRVGASLPFGGSLLAVARRTIARP
jgi:SAM-dependent methyltransferase